MAFRHDKVRRGGQHPAESRPRETNHAVKTATPRFNIAVALPREDHESMPLLSWALAAVLGGIVAGLIGLVITYGLCVLAWFDMPGTTLGSMFTVSSALWLLAHGAGVSTAATTITLAPLGLTVVYFLIALTCARFAGRQARLGAPELISAKIRLYLTLRTTVLFMVGYLLADFGVIAVSRSHGITQISLSVAGAAALAVIAGFVGAGRSCSLDVTMWLPCWAQAIPRAVKASCAVMIASGATVLLTSFIVHRSQVTVLHDSLHPAGTGHLSLILLELAWLPNFVLWAASYCVGAGFVIGIDTIISPGTVTIGLLPSLPVFGALPTTGNPSGWLFSWMAFPVAAGVCAAVVILWSRPRARWDVTASIGAVSGVVAGVIFTGLALLGNGALGTQRLAHIGIRPLETMVMASVVMGLSALVAGIAIGLIRGSGAGKGRRRRKRKK